MYSPLNTNRGLFKWLVFDLLTLGIYSCFLTSYMARETNTTCEGDGKKTAGFWAFFFLTIITFGIYSFVWNYKICDRLHDYCVRNGINARTTGGNFLCWFIFGAFIIVGPFIALYRQIHMLNDVNAHYNSVHFAARPY